jgi:hypothetical protein
MPSPTIAKLLNGTLKNGSNSNMGVDGSGTPVEFSLAPPTDADADIQTMCLLAEFAGSVAIGNKFIANTVGTLTNGLLVQAKLSDIEFTFANLLRTREVIELSPSDNGPNVIATGTYTLLQVFFYLPPFARMCKQGTFSTDDYVKATVRDDLTGIYFLEMFLQGVKV